MSQQVAQPNAAGEASLKIGRLDEGSETILGKHMEYLAYINSPDLFKVPSGPKERARTIGRYRDKLKSSLDLTDRQLDGLLALHKKPERLGTRSPEPAGPGAARDKIRARMIELGKARLAVPSGRIPGHEPRPLS